MSVTMKAIGCLKVPWWQHRFGSLIEPNYIPGILHQLHYNGLSASRSEVIFCLEMQQEWLDLCLSSARIWNSDSITLPLGQPFWSDRLHCVCVCSYFAALELSAVLPSEEEIKRWCGEPIKAVLIPTSIFLVNKRGERITRIISWINPGFWGHLG